MGYETTENLVWLLNTWLKAMSKVSPKTIITNQDVVITNFVARVFPKEKKI